MYITQKPIVLISIVINNPKLAHSEYIPERGDIDINDKVEIPT